MAQIIPSLNKTTLLTLSNFISGEKRAVRRLENLLKIKPS